MRVGRVRQARPSVYVLDVGPVLSRLEIEILQFAADGFSAAETAVELRYSAHHVKGVFKGIYRKVDARSKAHAVAIAWRAGLIS